MVRSEAVDVETYLAEVEPERQAALSKLRRLCLAELDGYTEEMAYGMPSYSREGTVEIAFASQKQYIAFYLLRGDVRDDFESRLALHDMGKGCLRFRDPGRVDFDLVRDLLRATASKPGPIC